MAPRLVVKGAPEPPHNCNHSFQKIQLRGYGGPSFLYGRLPIARVDLGVLDKQVAVLYSAC